MGVKPMSPSANFTTYRLPPSSNSDVKTNGFAHHSYSLPRSKAATSSGLFRFLLCSRPCFQHSVEIEEDIATADLNEENAQNSNLENGSSDVDLQLRMELQSVMRHLEVRWQLFDEALSRFADLEAMLAICADNVRWRHHTSNGVKNANVAEDLKSLILRKLSMEVSIYRLTQLSSCGNLGTSFNQDGHSSKLQSRDQTRLQAALDYFYEGRNEIRSSRTSVLEEDTYILRNRKGEVVEEGKQVVIWEQYNSTWYIRGCVSYPGTSKVHA